MTITPLLSVAPDKFLSGEPDKLIANELPQLWGYEALPWRDALERRWPTDAHFVSYWAERDGKVLPFTPRLEKGCLVRLRAAGIHLKHGMLAADIDCPDHVKLTAAFLDDARARLEGKNVCWYPTLGGLRVLRPLTAAVRSEEYEFGAYYFIDEVRGWFDAHERRPGAWRVDMLPEWTRHFRCPRVTRDGVPTWEVTLG